MTNQDDLDGKLKEFLDAATRERAAGYTIANVVLSQKEQGRQLRELIAWKRSVEERLDGQDTRFDRHGREIRALKSHTGYDGEADTGQHDIAVVKAEVERQKAEREAEARAKRDDVVWWKRSVIGWVVIAFGFVLSVTLSQVLNALLGKK